MAMRNLPICIDSDGVVLVDDEKAIHINVGTLPTSIVRLAIET